MEFTRQIYDDFKAGSIEDFYAACWHPLMSYASRLLGEHYAMLSEDCVQEAIFSTYRNRQSMASPLQLKTYLFTCLHNHCISLLRKAGSEERYVARQQEGEEVVQEEISAALIEQETIDLIHAAINELPQPYRELFELNFEQGLRNEEAAQQLGISLSAFNKRKSKMLQLLRTKFEGDEGIQLLLTLLFLVGEEGQKAL